MRRSKKWMSSSVKALKAWLMEKREEVEGGVWRVESVVRDVLATEAAVWVVEERDACRGDWESGEG